MKDRPIPTLRYGDAKEQPTPSNSKLCECGVMIDKRFELCNAKVYLLKRNKL